MGEMGLKSGKLILVALYVCVLQAAALGTSYGPSAARAQIAADSYGAILVRGNQRIENATILNFAALKPGTPISGGQINAAYQRLVATGLFEEVSITPSGNSLVIKVQEYPTINRINFERNRKIKDEKLAEVITSKTRHTYNPAQVEADAALIVEAYRQSGRHTAEVKPKIIRRADNRVDIAFEIFEGKPIEIQRLGFVGNRNFSDRRLRRVLGTKQAGLLRAFIKRDSFVADRIAFDRQVLTDFYLSRGFIDFQVLSVSTEVARQRNGFFLTFNVREGQSYDFGEISVTSALAEIDPDEYKALIRVKTGITYAPNHVEKTIERLETHATRQGLNFIRVTPRINRNDDSRTLDVEFVIERGPRVFVERIDIEGNATTLDRVVRRQFETVEGDPFNPRQIRAASERIRALGFFSKVDATTREGSSPDRVVVDVNVEEQPTGSLDFGVAFGAASGIGAKLALSESNFLGRGQYVKFEYAGATASQDITIEFAEPAFLGRNLRLGTKVYRQTTQNQNASYNTTSAAGELSLGFPSSENGNLRFGYKGGADVITGVNQRKTSALITNGVRTISMLSGGYTYDTRTTGLNPKAGTIINVSQEIGLGSSRRYIKSSALLGARTSMFNDEIGLSAEFEGGLLNSIGGPSYIGDRFFMGQQIMRGYAFNGIGPRELKSYRKKGSWVPLNKDALGGNVFAVARFETNFPLGLPEEYGMAGGAFVDVGSLWGLDNRDGGRKAGDGKQLVDDSMHIRSVIGLSLFWDTIVGPLRFNFTRVLRGPSYDKPEAFSLSFGRRF